MCSANVILTIFLSIVNLITALLHLFGLHFLRKEYKNGLQDSQQVYLINIAKSESAINILQLLLNPSPLVFKMTPMLGNAMLISQDYIKMIRGYGFVTVYFLSMFYLTLDRLMDIRLSIKYNLYWNEFYTERLLKFTWICSCVVTATVCLVHHFYNVNFNLVLDIYIYPICNLLFVTIIVITYGFIFIKYKQTRVSPVQKIVQGRSFKSNQSVLKVFKRSRFYIPMLLIASFIVFMVVPEWTHLFVVVLRNEKSITLNLVLMILWTFSYFVDAVIYIWIKPSFKKEMKRRFGVYRKRN